MLSMPKVGVAEAGTKLGEEREGAGAATGAKGSNGLSDNDEAVEDEAYDEDGEDEDAPGPME